MRRTSRKSTRIAFKAARGRTGRSNNSRGTPAPPVRDSGYNFYNEQPPAYTQHQHSCNGHHCYHTTPGVYGASGRGDTYDDTRCCHCGQSEPNPYENERR